MKTRLLLAATCSLLLSGAISLRGQAADAATLYRDEFGIPHVYAPTLETAAFAVGYAQAEDRLEELLKNYRRANGTMSEVFGPSQFRNDMLQRLFRHEEISREKYGSLSPKMRAVIEAYQAGIKYFMKEHPEQVPAWAQEIHPWDVVALGRFIIWGWPLGEAGGDLLRAGIQPDEMAYHGSNEILIGPSRTALKVPIAVVDPHLSWYGEFRFYQVRIYAGDFNASGVSILGTPLPNMGHNRYCSIAMTTGGPDTSDVFAEELNPDNPRQYRYDGRWRELQVHKTRIGVKTGDKVDWKELELEYSHHGPIVAHRNGKAYAVAIPYAEEVGLMDQTYDVMTARNLADMKRALARFQLMAQNVMVATVQGDIYYVRNGRVPIRAPGTDPSRPIPGASSTNEWRGLHPFADLVQIENPPQGYMHNCNVTPFGMMKDSPLTPEKYARFPYLYNATRNAPRHQRADMMTELLDTAHGVTVAGAIALAFNPQVYHAEKWQQRLNTAWTKASDTDKKGDTAEVYSLIQQWNRRSDADSEGALAYYALKKGLDERNARAVDPPSDLADEPVLAALGKAAEWLKANFGSLHVAYGKYFRVGREGGQHTYPVGGGSVGDAGMATVRAIGFNKVGKSMVGHSGQTSTQVVIMTDPPESYTIVPLGVSDHPESGHWDDQAEKLFSQSKAAPAYFMNRNELLKHVTATRILKPALAPQAGRQAAPQAKGNSYVEQGQ
ncbi:MAG: penicillin acylase family protein [Limisphaerales bacterium]